MVFDFDDAASRAPGVIVLIYAVLDHMRGTPDRAVRVEVGIGVPGE